MATAAAERVDSLYISEDQLHASASLAGKKV